MTNPLVFYTRSAREADWTCQRKRFYLTEHPSSKGATGIVPATRGLALDEGLIIHEVMPLVLLAKDEFQFEIAVGDAMDRMKNDIGWATEWSRLEQQTMIEGLMRAVWRHIRPRILEEYDVVQVERELQIHHHGVVQGAKPDTVLRRKADGALRYMDWKSTASLSLSFFDSWETAVQLQWGCVAIEKALGEPCDHAIVQALYKGRMVDGELSSIFAYGYSAAKRPAGSKLSYAYVRGLRKYPVWEEPGGIKKWIEEMPQEILVAQIPESRTVSVKRAQIEASLRQAAIREKEIYASGALIRQLLAQTRPNRGRIEWHLDHNFPQTFSACTPVVGYACPYKPLCFNPIAQRNPEAHGFVPREPHHEQEKALKGLTEE
jgi:hypothetical protein